MIGENRKLGPVYTIDDEVGSWKMVIFNGPRSWSDFFTKNSIESLGPSLGVNRMWAKKNDHVPKSECANFF